MFENLLAQDQVKNSLIHDIERASLPPSLLFSGPCASGKMTAALELARVLSCGQDGRWNCPCPDCARHRFLVHGDLIVLGKRSLPEEILVAREFLGRAPGQGSRYFFVRSVRKLLSRFNPILWAGEETKLIKASTLIQSLEEDLDRIQALERSDGAESDLSKLADSIVADAANLETFVPEQPPIFMIRNLGSWARLSPISRRKTVVIENAERMQDSSRNALLKILEEPPETIRFVLLTSRRASMMATIVSRSRMYAFSPRNEESARLVASRVFKTEENVTDLQAFFESKTGFSPDSARQEAQRFVGILLAQRNALGKEPPLGNYANALARAAEDQDLQMREFLDGLAKASGGFGMKDKKLAGSFPKFLRAILGVFDEMLKETKDDPGTVALIDRWTRLLRTAAVHYQSLNRSPELLVEILANSFGESE
jgi:DNA polymerase-3 subunit gamma/tau